MGKAKYCACCGKRGVRWPKYRPQVCTMRCAANRWIADDSPSSPYCMRCGLHVCECPNQYDDVEEEGK